MLAAYGDLRILAKDKLPNWEEPEPVEIMAQTALAESEGGLNAYAAECHEANKKWWIDLNTGAKLERNTGELLMLVVSEIAEAMEGARKNLPDDKLPHRKMLEVELVDALIRIFDFAGAKGLDLQGAYEEKMAFNATRVDHSHEHRKSEHGKKF